MGLHLWMQSITFGTLAEIVAELRIQLGLGGLPELREPRQ